MRLTRNLQRAVIVAASNALAISVTCSSAAATAPASSTAGASSPVPLSAVAFLAGDWTLDAKWANGNPLKARATFTVENEGTAISGRTFVIDDQGRASQRDLTVFAIHDGTLTQFVFHHDGSARVTPAELGDGNALVFEWTKPGSAGKPDLPLRQVWTPIDADQFRWQSFSQLNGEWHSTVDGVWTRKGKP